jgi:plasmid rolling circle replication initiator protein Rep
VSESKSIDFSSRYDDILERRKANEKFIEWYNKLDLDKNAFRISTCCNYWDWDVYQKNRLLSFEGVYRCKDRFCANCAKVRVIKSLLQFVPKFLELLENGLTCYMVTLTIPNTKTLDDNFLSLFRKKVYDFNRRFVNGPNGLKERPFNIEAAVYSLEITRNRERMDWHPHIHGLIFTDKCLPEDFVHKDKPDGYQKRSKQYIYRSEADEYIRKVWTAIWNGKRVNQVLKAPDNPSEWLRADIRKADSKAPFEVFKYMIKHTDIKSFEEFETMYKATYKKRLFQAYGKLYNMKIDDVDEEDELREIDDEKLVMLREWMDVDPEEEAYPEKYITIEETKSRYGEFKKVNVKKTLTQRLSELKEKIRVDC